MGETSETKPIQILKQNNIYMEKRLEQKHESRSKRTSRDPSFRNQEIESCQLEQKYLKCAKNPLKN